jgi:phage baseplate assembly protein W
MTKEFLQLPLQIDLIIRQKQLKRCSLNESVASMMHLIIITRFDENKQDRTFGNELWEHDFETIENTQAFKEELTEALQKTISRHEKRLSDVKVEIGFEQVLTTVYNRRVKQKILVIIEGTLRKTNEKFSYSEEFYTGPLSYY